MGLPLVKKGSVGDITEVGTLAAIKHNLSSLYKLILYHTGLSLTHLSTEVAGVFGVLTNLNLLYHLPERGAITGTVLADNTDLLRSFCLEANTHKNEPFGQLILYLEGLAVPCLIRL